MDAHCTRILLVGAYPLLCGGLALLLAGRAGFTICGQVNDGAKARRACEELRPDLVVLDLDWPAIDGIALLRDFARLHRAGQRLVLSGREDAQALQSALRAGADGYFSKRAGVAEFLEALGAVAAGEFYVSRCLAGGIFQKLARGQMLAPADEVGTLSAREREVFRLIGSGAGATAIARGLGITVKTVETHQQRIKVKLELGDGEQLKRRAVEWVAARIHAGEAAERGTGSTDTPPLSR